MKSDHLLIELLVEELPPKALKKIGQAFVDAIKSGLEQRGLLGPSAQAQGFATPRRLGVLISDVLESAPDKRVKLKIMPVSVALDANGAPTPALLKKLGALGLADLTVGEMVREIDGKSETLFCDRVQSGVALTQGLQATLTEMLGKLPIPKVMSYQLQKGCELPGWSTVHFVRPAQSLVALFGVDVVGVQLLGLHAGRTTKGHRFECAQDAIELSSALDYEPLLLERGHVIASYEKRRALIQTQLTQRAAELGENFVALEDDALLDEVCSLVEYPNVLVCGFESEFLQVPQECLILTMKSNQKYFPLLDKEGRLTHQFLVVSNISPSDASAVIQGNERVVRPRLADAKFFFEQDKKKTLASRIPLLERVVYHNLLGSQGERVTRVVDIVRVLAEQLGPDQVAPEDLQHALTAAQLAKADLLTDMVSEFPELQGIMGMYYARSEGLPEAVAFAIEDHYKPRFAGDSLARGRAGILVALADKLETLVGLFGIAQAPSGDKDPFALRRHALGIVRMIVDGNLNLPLTPMLEAVAAVFGDKLKLTHAQLIEQIKGFIYDRMSNSLKEQGFSVKEVDAVTAQAPELIAQIPLRVAAVHEFSSLAEAPALAAANKRIGNILKKEEVSTQGALSVKPEHFASPQEQALYDALQALAQRARAKLDHMQFAAALVELAALKAPVDAFFDHVMVNDPNEQLRQNRLALLGTLHAEMNRVADLARLA